MAAIGLAKGVAEVFGIPLWGLPAWLLVARLLLVADADARAARCGIFVEWTWGMFFATDITHLRFTRTPRASEPGTAS